MRYQGEAMHPRAGSQLRSIQTPPTPAHTPPEPAVPWPVCPTHMPTIHVQSVSPTEHRSTESSHG